MRNDDRNLKCIRNGPKAGFKMGVLNGVFASNSGRGTTFCTGNWRVKFCQQTNYKHEDIQDNN